MPRSAPEEAAKMFRLFNEIGILQQLSRAMLERHLDGLTVLHFSVLNHLVRVGEGPTPLRLSRAFQVPKTTMSFTLKGLVARDLVRLEPSPEDGRAKCVFLTDAGRRFREEAIAAIGPELTEVMPHLPAGLADDLLPGLTRLREVLDAARD